MMDISYREELKRKAVHLSSLWLVLATLWIPNRAAAAVLFAALLAGTLFAEHAYACGRKGIGELYGKLFGKMLRKTPKPGAWIVSGGAPVLGAALMVNLLFPRTAAACALAVMLLGDTAAALVGRKYGTVKLVGKKSLQGTLAFFTAGCLGAFSTLLIGSGWTEDWKMVPIAAAAGAVVELYTEKIGIDDNFTIPLTVGLVMSLSQFL